MITTHNTYISATAGEFESAVELCEKTFGSFSYFTVRNGKAQYHVIMLADKSVGVYYALREFPDGLGAKRTLEPTDEIKLHPEAYIDPYADSDSPEAMGYDRNYPKYYTT